MFVKRRPPVGASPGTLAIPEGAPPPRIRLIEYTADSIRERECTDPSELELPQEGVVWIDVQGLGDAAPLEQLARLLGIHLLALEDAVNAPQRPKSEVYPEHHQMVARAPRPRDSGEGFELVQVSILSTRQWVITFQEQYYGLFDEVRSRLRSGGPRIRRLGADYLAYALLDAAADHYYPVVERVSRELEALEDKALEDGTSNTLESIHLIRREITELRRVVWPMRELVRDLLVRDSPFITEEVRTYLRDTHDHLAHVADVIDASRDLSVSLMDIHLSTVAQRTNDVMKVLTLMASVFIPLTFIAGIYGMNFQHMPELALPWAYPAALGVMAAVAAVMVGYFWKKGWIGK